MYRAVEPRTWREVREQAEAKAAAERQRIIDERNALYARMKPNDGTIAFIQDPDAAAGVIIAVDPRKLLEHYNSARSASSISKSKIRQYAKVASANNDLHLMPVIYWGDDATIHMQDGNHRLNYLQYKPYILVTVANWMKRSDAEFESDIQKIIDICGGDNPAIIHRGNAVFCHITFDESGYYGVRALEQKIIAPYYSVKEPEASPTLVAIATSQPTRHDPAPSAIAPDTSKLG